MSDLKLKKSLIATILMIKNTRDPKLKDALARYSSDQLITIAAGLIEKESKGEK